MGQLILATENTEVTEISAAYFARIRRVAGWNSYSLLPLLSPVQPVLADFQQEATEETENCAGFTPKASSPCSRSAAPRRRRVPSRSPGRDPRAGAGSRSARGRGCRTCGPGL